MIKGKKGGILLSVCQGGLLVAVLGIIVATSCLLTLQGVKHSQIMVEGIIYANNLIEEIKGQSLENYEKNIPLEGFFTTGGEYLNVWLEVEKIDEFYVIRVILRYLWGDGEKELIVEGYKYGGS
jgi:hypothetical protein